MNPSFFLQVSCPTLQAFEWKRWSCLLPEGGVYLYLEIADSVHWASQKNVTQVGQFPQEVLITKFLCDFMLVLLLQKYSDLLSELKNRDKTFPRNSHLASLWNNTALCSAPISSFWIALQLWLCLWHICKKEDPHTGSPSCQSVHKQWTNSLCCCQLLHQIAGQNVCFWVYLSTVLEDR